jgi:hypothetical protein
MWSFIVGIKCGFSGGERRKLKHRCVGKYVLFDWWYIKSIKLYIYCSTLATWVQVILFLEMLKLFSNILSSKKFFWEGKFRIFWNILNFFFLEVELSKLINKTSAQGYA